MKHIETHGDLEIQNVLRNPRFSWLHAFTMSLGMIPTWPELCCTTWNIWGSKRDWEGTYCGTSQHLMIFHFFAGWTSIYSVYCDTRALDWRTGLTWICDSKPEMFHTKRGGFCASATPSHVKSHVFCIFSSHTCGYRRITRASYPLVI